MLEFTFEQVKLFGVIVAILVLCLRLHELILAIVMLVIGAFVGNYVQQNKDEVKEIIIVR